MTDLKNMTLGRRIQALRRKQALTQEYLAERMSVTPQAVSKWENDLSCPDILALPQLAKELQVTIDALLTGEAAPAAVNQAPAKRPEELIIRIAFTDDEGTRIGLNLPFPVFKPLVRHRMLSIRFTGENGEFDVNDTARLLHDMDFEAIVTLVEAGVSGKLLEMQDCGEALTIWTE